MGLYLICSARIGGGQKFIGGTEMDQYHTSLHIVGIIEKYDHIQTGLEKKFGLYGVVFSGIYNSKQIRYGVGLYGHGVILHKVSLYGGGLPLSQASLPTPVSMLNLKAVT